VNINNKQLDKIVENALKEDLGFAGDITSDNLIADCHESKAILKFKEKGVLAGIPVVKKVFSKYDSDICIDFFKQDGEVIENGESIAEIKGNTCSILKGERTALNFLQRLTGIATQTAKYVDKVNNDSIRITDTRKTTPTLRILEKYAVRVGSGYNHRFGLYDAVMLKDNHIIAAGGIKKAVKKIRSQISHTVKIEVEVENFKQVKKAVSVKADIIMLDNMELDEMEKAVNYIGEQAIVEASGGITLENIKAVANTGVNVISIGALTHQLKSIDISLDFVGES